MDIIRSHWLPILAFLIIVAMISISTATDRQSSATDFNPDYPIGTPPILGGTGCVIETANGWHNAQDWGEYNADYSGYHPGEDWNYGSGTDDVGEPVYAIASGTIFDTRNALFNDEGGYGSGIAIKHTMPNGEEIYSVYEHIDIISGLSIGDSVWQGDKIGSIADTTKLSPHLHFEIRTTQMDKNDWYPNDNGYGYYSSEEKLHIDGFTVDPSDFIDSHRSTAESLDAWSASQVTLTLYVHDGRADGPIISGATVTGQDASGNSFEEVTNSEGYVTIAGDPGTWSFSVSADGYEINSWDQEIAEADTKDAFLQMEKPQEFEGVKFPNGLASFADHVVSYNPCKGGKAPHNNPNNALGSPDYNGVDSASYVSLGNAENACDCGSLILEFTDNALVDVPGNDLYVFEVGPSVEATEVFISIDGQDWIYLGKIEGSSWGIDVHDHVPSDQEFHFVRRCDYPDGKTSSSPTPGPDIDAVGAVGNPQ
jgi:hypothetical protein